MFFEYELSVCRSYFFRLIYKEKAAHKKAAFSL